MSKLDRKLNEELVCSDHFCLAKTLNALKTERTYFLHLFTLESFNWQSFWCGTMEGEQPKLSERDEMNGRVNGARARTACMFQGMSLCPCAPTWTAVSSVWSSICSSSFSVLFVQLLIIWRLFHPEQSFVQWFATTKTNFALLFTRKSKTKSTKIKQKYLKLLVVVFFSCSENWKYLWKQKRNKNNIIIKCATGKTNAPIPHAPAYT